MMRSLSKPPIVLGLVGDAATGKDTIAQVFKKYGFVTVTTGDDVREMIIKDGHEPSRKLQLTYANRARELNGSSYFIEAALGRLAAAGKSELPTVVTGLYAPGEGKYLIERLSGALIRVVASAATLDEHEPRMRFDRLSARADGARDDLNFGEFFAAYQSENGGVELHEANVATLAMLARFMICNDVYTDEVHLDQQVSDILKEIEYERV